LKGSSIFQIFWEPAGNSIVGAVLYGFAVRPPQMGKLTKIEILFLGWLRDQGGKCALDRNDEFSKYYRLVNAGFIEVQLPDRFNPAVVTFKLTESGQEILKTVERTQLNHECRLTIIRCGRIPGTRHHVPPLNFKPIIVHGDQVL
jgi:hypothetical protein